MSETCKQVRYKTSKILRQVRQVRQVRQEIQVIQVRQVRQVRQPIFHYRLLWKNYNKYKTLRS